MSILLFFAAGGTGGTPVQAFESGSVLSAESVPGPAITGGVADQAFAVASIASAENVAAPNVFLRQQVPLGSVGGEPSVGGPAITLPAAPAPGSRLVVRVMDRDNPLVERAELDERVDGAGFQRARKAAGSGKVTLLNDDPNLAAVRYGDLLRFEIDGQARFLSIVEKKTAKILDRDEEAAEVTELDGRGHLAILDRAVVFPEAGTDTLPVSDVRVFNFAARGIDDSGWAAAGWAALGAGGQPDPEGWPDPDARKVWAGWPVMSGNAPAGDVYLRRAGGFNVAADGTYRLFATGDDGFEVWVDGVLILGETRPFLWRETKQVDVHLTAGNHTIAIKGTNLNRGIYNASNVAWVMASLFSLSEGGTALGDVICRTDSSWVGVGYPPTPPGFTPGRVMRILLEEAQARGALAGVTLAFSDTADSAGNAWETQPDLAFRIGDTLLMVAEQLAETHLDELRMAPAAFTLHAYTTRGETAPIALAVGANLTELTTEGTI